MILPVISLSAYNILVFFPLLRAVLAAKVAENSTDYSLNNTVRNMLFLPCTYEQKFSAKQAIDSFFVRMGDVLSALSYSWARRSSSLHPRGFAAVNAVLVLAWLVAGVAGWTAVQRADRIGQATGDGRITSDRWEHAHEQRAENRADDATRPSSPRRYRRRQRSRRPAISPALVGGAFRAVPGAGTGAVRSAGGVARADGCRPHPGDKADR